jgi:precorrin isomerase
MQYIQQPQAIEAKSFDIIGEIIRKPVRTISLPVRYIAIIKRVIHTTADFDWLDILWFSRCAGAVLRRLAAERDLYRHHDGAFRDQ